MDFQRDCIFLIAVKDIIWISRFLSSFYNRSQNLIDLTIKMRNIRTAKKHQYASVSVIFR